MIIAPLIWDNSSGKQAGNGFPTPVHVATTQLYTISVTTLLTVHTDVHAGSFIAGTIVNDHLVQMRN